MLSVNAVLFDYGLVLTEPPDPEAWEQMQRVVDADEASFRKAYWKHRTDYDRGTLTATAYWRQVAADVQMPLEDRQLAELIDADTTLWTQPNQPMIDWAAALQRSGMRTGILSNIGDAMETGIMARCAWLAGFTHRTFSHRLKMAKPEPAIYRHAVDGLGVLPSEVLFIDDREDNIAAALAVGLQALQYTNHPAFLPAMREAGFAHLLAI